MTNVEVLQQTLASSPSPSVADPVADSSHEVLAFAYTRLVQANPLPTALKLRVMQACLGSAVAAEDLMKAFPGAAGAPAKLRLAPSQADEYILLRLTDMVRGMEAPWPHGLVMQLRRIAGVKFDAWSDLLAFVAMARVFFGCRGRGVGS